MCNGRCIDQTGHAKKQNNNVLAEPLLLLLVVFLEARTFFRLFLPLLDFSQKFATQWKRRFRPHKVYIFLISMTRRVDLAMSVCLSVSTQTSLSVLKLSGWNFPKRLMSFAGSIYISRNQPYRTTISYSSHRNNRKKTFLKIISLVFFNI